MGKVRHRKRTRTARLEATATPLTGADSSSSAGTNGTTKLPAVQKKEQEISNVLDKLRSSDARDRVWASSTLSSLLLTLPAVHLRLLLSRNLIGLLIERLTLPIPAPPSSPDAFPAAPSSDDLTTAVEALGTLRNLAVSSPPHIISEMHNKRLLLPLLSSHLPLLLAYLPTVLAPAQPPVKPSLPATPADRTACDLVNEANETLRRVYWDWAENVLVLLWCLSESNTKILASLNAQGDKIVELIMAFLEEDKLGIAESAGLEDHEGVMQLDAKKKQKSKKDKDKEKKALRVPLFVAVAAAQTLHAFVSSNPAANPHLLSSPGSQTFSPTLSSLLSILLTPAAPNTKSTEAQEYWTQLRVLSFGTLLELAKSKSKRKDIDQVRDVLKEDGGAKRILFEIVQQAGEQKKLEGWVQESAKVASQIDPTAPQPPTPAPNSPQAQLNSLERQAQTLQLALEVLSEYLASGLSTPGSATAGQGMGDDEEWGGISMDVEEGDLDMDEDGDDDAMGAEEGDVEVEGDESEMDGDDMLEDLENIVGDDSEDSDDEEAGSSSSKLSLTSLPLQLLSLSQPTSLSFVPASSFAATPDGADPSTGLISTAATPNSTTLALPALLSTLSDAVTAIHVRAIEALNNLFVALAQSKKPYGRGKGKEKELQTVFEKVLEGMHHALTSVKPAEKKTGEDEVDEVEERREELISASAGVVWGCTRLGLEDDGSLIVGPSTTPFLIDNVYSSTFASAPTPQGEAIRVRALGALGQIGRRKDVPIEENAHIGQFMLSLLPSSTPRNAAAAQQPVASPLTPDALLQVVDSFIDLYADEEREYDVPNFRNGGMLPILETTIAGVRAAIKKIDRKKFPELRLRADGALENLVAFTQYRKDLLKPAKGGRR
ncbi:Syo1p [Sporobolomyces koalae]|uniref:Syo1p n=1 Tax=Sporobolomyces koalae TaxID=500713 RepID=UPI00317018CA